MFKSKKQPRRRALRAGLAAGMTLIVGAALSAGCLDRPAVEQQPNTSNVFVDRIVNTKIDKIDLLFTIDNSVSMADKQSILEAAVPNLVRRLVNPSCVNRDTGELSPYNGTDCPEGSKREFDPIENIHIGVVTSSLGGHGGPNNNCAAPIEEIVHVNDKGELLPNVRTGLPAHDPAGFLHWRGAAQDDETAFINDFTAHVTGAGETGCGFEATMEGWYRFLVDPEPPVDMGLNADNVAVPTAINEALLAQRAAFLRPDSLVAIIMLSDENDCSIRDGGTDWLAARVGGGNQLWAASETCDTDPNSECCHSCRVAPPSGCPASTRCGGDPSAAPQLEPLDDQPNIRCHAQKRRFGVEFLYSAQRYIDGLTQPMIPRRSDGELVPNPLFTPGESGLPRDRSLVFLAGIIGVPWQDIATEDSLDLNSPKLEFLTADQLATEGRWAVILGDPATGTPPTDPLMIESVDPRSGSNPITGDALVTADNPRGNPINGHEFNNPGRDDLQYACTFPLSPALTPADCETKPVGACDCIAEDDATMQKPLCFDGPGSAFSTTQSFAKAYPGTRYLEVLKGFGGNSIVASICPKNLVGSDPSDPNVGYNPAVGAIVKRLGEALSGRCLPRELDVDEETGDVPCAVVEVVPGAGIGCGQPGRSDVQPAVADAIRKQLIESETCRQDDPNCSQFTMCNILPLEGEALQQCLFDEDATNNAIAPGYCYVDPGKGLPQTGAQGDGCTPDAPESCTNPLVEACPATERRLLRFVGSPTTAITPAPGSTTFVACVGSALSQ